MSIDDEIAVFEGESTLLAGFVDSLSAVDPADVNQEHLFLSEAVVFRMYRIYERLVRAVFLSGCVEGVTVKGSPIVSKLKCDDWDTAEQILKSGNKFLDWGNVVTVRKLSNLVFENGFPVVDFVGPKVSTLVDLQRFRNFVAHDSAEAADGFKKSRAQYVKIGHVIPETVGYLSLYRRSALSDSTIKIVHGHISDLSALIRGI